MPDVPRAEQPALRIEQREKVSSVVWQRGGNAAAKLRAVLDTDSCGQCRYPQRDGDCQYDREYVHRDLLPFLFTADCEPRDLTETPVAGDESWHIETVAKRDANKKALEQVEKATGSEPVKGKELLESDELKRKLSEAEERFRSGLSPKKAKSESR